MCLKVFLADRTRWRYRCFPFIAFHSGGSGHYILRLRHYFRGGSGSCQTCNQKTAFGSISNSLFFTSERHGIAKCVLSAFTQAIKTIYATTVINVLLLAIDARCFAFGGTESAMIAFFRINADFE